MRENNYCAILNLSGATDYLTPLTNHRPVASLPFAGRYRIIDFMLSSMSHANVESAAIFIDGSGRSIYDHVRSGKEWDFDSSIKGGLFTFSQQVWKRFEYIHQERTDDFYIDHREFLKKSEEEYVVVVGGEIIQTVDIEAILKHHKAKEADITVTYKAGNYSRLDKLEIDEQGYVISLNGNHKDVSLTEVYFLKVDLVNELLDKACATHFYENLSHVIKEFMLDYKVSAFEYTGFMEPITTIQDYFDVSMKLLELDHFNALFNGSIPIITKSQSGAPTYYSKDVVVRNAQIATNALIEGDIENSLLFRKVIVKPGSDIKNSVVMSGCTIGENAKLNYVILDKGVTVDPDLTLSGTHDNVLVIPKNTRVTLGYES